MPPKTELAKQPTVPAALDHLPRHILRSISFYLTEKERAQLRMVNRNLHKESKLHIDDLPEEILLHMLSFLDPKKVNQVVAVNRLFNRLGLDEIYWRRLLAYYFYPEQSGSDLKPGETWRQRYYKVYRHATVALPHFDGGVVEFLGCVWRKIDSDLSQTPVPEITMRWVSNVLLTPGNLCFIPVGQREEWSRQFINEMCLDQELVNAVNSLHTPESNDSSRLTEQQTLFIRSTIRKAADKLLSASYHEPIELVGDQRPTAYFLTIANDSSSFKPTFLKKQFLSNLDVFYSKVSDLEKFRRTLSAIKDKVAREEYLPDELLTFMDDLLKTPAFLRKIVQDHEAFKNYFRLLTAEQSQLLLEQFVKSDRLRSFVEEELGRVFRNRAMIFSQMCFDIIPEEKADQRLQFARLLLEEDNFKFIVLSPADLNVVAAAFADHGAELHKMAFKKDNIVHFVRNISDCLDLLRTDFGGSVDKALMFEGVSAFLTHCNNKIQQILNPDDPHHTKSVFDFMYFCRERNFRVYLYKLRDDLNRLQKVLTSYQSESTESNVAACLQRITAIKKNLCAIEEAELMGLSFDEFNGTYHKRDRDNSFFDLPDRRVLYDAEEYCAKHEGCAIDYLALLGFLYGREAWRLNHLERLSGLNIRKFRSSLLNYVDLLALAGTAYTQRFVIRRLFSQDGPHYRMRYLLLLQGNNLKFDRRIDSGETYFSIRWEFLLIQRDLPNVFYFVGMSGNINFIETFIHLYDEMVNQFKEGSSLAQHRDRAGVFKSNRHAQAALTESILCSENPEALLWLVKNDRLRLSRSINYNNYSLYQMIQSFFEIEKAIKKAVKIIPSSSSKIRMFAKKAINHDEINKIKYFLENAYELSSAVYDSFMEGFLTNQEHSFLKDCPRSSVLKVLLPLPEFHLSQNPEILRKIAAYFSEDEVVKDNKNIAQALIERAENIEKNRGDADVEKSDSEIEVIRTSFSRMGG